MAQQYRTLIRQYIASGGRVNTLPPRAAEGSRIGQEELHSTDMELPPKLLVERKESKDV